MILKLILLIVVITTVYFLFFKKKPITNRVHTKQRTGKKKKRESNEMIACAKCGTYVAVDDAFIKSGRYYCSQECMNG